MILAQNTFTVKRLAKDEFVLHFSQDTMAIPATSAGVADLTLAEFAVKVTKGGKELFPNFDESIGGTPPVNILNLATISTFNCSVAIVGDKVKLTTLTSNKASGYVDVTVTYGDDFTDTRRFTWVLAKEGGSGQSVDKIEDQFYLSTSKTTQTGGSWVSTPPAWVEGKYLWKRLKITYKNPTEVDYSLAQYYTEWDAVDGILTDLRRVESDTEARFLQNEDSIGLVTSTVVDVLDELDDVEHRLSESEAKILVQEENINAKVSNTEFNAYGNAVSSKFSEIDQGLDDMTLAVGKKVGYDEVVASINLSPESIKIDAEKIQFTGSVSFKSASRDAVEEDILDAVQEAKEYVDDLEIGGRNLLDGTSDEWNTTNIVASWSYPYGGSSNSPMYFDVKEGTYYTFSVEVKDIPLRTKTYIRFFDSSNQIVGNASSKEWTEATTEAILTATGQAPEGAVSLVLAIGIESTAPNTTVYYRKGQLEEGSKRTSWGRSQNDILADITTAKQEALTAAGNAQNTANSLKDFTDTAFRDGIIDRSESVAIEKYKNSLNEAMAKAEASYNKVYTNTYLEGTAKTSLLNAKVNLWGQRDTLLSAINTAISGGITTPAQKTAVDNAFSTFNNLMTAFQNALEEANKAIQTKLDNIAKGYVDNLQVGAQNLIVGTAFYEVPSNITARNGYAVLSVDSAEKYNLNNSLKIETTKAGTTGTDLQIRTIRKEGVAGQFRLSFFAKSSVADTKAFFRWGFGNFEPAVSIGTDWTFVEIQINATTAHGLNLHPYFDKIATVWICDMMLNEGNKTAPWGLSTIDIENGINDSKLTAERAQLQADGYMRARYIRDWVGQNSVNAWAGWSEVEVFSKDGTNIALGKTVTGIRTQHPTNIYSRITDGNINTVGQPGSTIPSGTADWIIVDLGQVYYDIDFIRIWHTWSDGRTYTKTKTEISEDGVNWTTIFDSATEGTYAETAEGKIHSQRYNTVLAKLNQSKAITDKFATEINGGLITTVMMLLREANSQINTAGFSGIQKDNNGIANQPSYWSGGTYEQAMTFVPFVKKLENEQSTSLEEYNNLPSIVFLHSGAAKVGHFIVLTSGEILVVDPATGSVKLKFTTADLPAIADLVSGTNSQGSTAVGAGVASISSSQVVSGSTVVSKNGAIATFNGTHISLSARGVVQAGGMASFAEAVLYARQNGVRVQRLASVTVHFTNTVYEDKSAEVLPVPFSFPLDAGTYTFELVIHTTGTISSGNAVTSASTLSWKHTVAGVKKQQYSKDGMMFFYSNRHFYFNELTGLDVKESDSKKFNLPGVLLSATVNAGGGWGAIWGAKQSSTQPVNNSTGRYTVYHTVGHTNYQVNAIPNTSNRTCHIVSKATSNFVIEWRTVSSSPTLVNTGFDFQIIGNNYAQ